MRTEPRFIVALLALLLLAFACEDLTVELDDPGKDDLAAWVERGGQPAAPPIDLSPRPVTDLPRLDHLGLTAVLHAFTHDGFVAYDALLASPDALEVLDAYLDLLAAANPDALADGPERVAFWINAYNAHTLRQVTRELPDDPAFSVQRDDFAFFKTRRHTVGGRVWSLDQIEHLILRGDANHSSAADLSSDDRAEALRLHAAAWGGQPLDPRIHMGLNCASFSCPLLPDAAFTGPRLDEQLDAQAARFVYDPARGAGPDGISLLFFWFEPDFGGAQGAQTFIQRYRDDTAAVRFDRFLDYDWTLNATPPGP